MKKTTLLKSFFNVLWNALFSEHIQCVIVKYTNQRFNDGYDRFLAQRNFNFGKMKKNAVKRYLNVKILLPESFQCDDPKTFSMNKLFKITK